MTHKLKDLCSQNPVATYLKYWIFRKPEDFRKSFDDARRQAWPDRKQRHWVLSCNSAFEILTLSELVWVSGAEILMAAPGVLIALNGGAIVL